MQPRDPRIPVNFHACFSTADRAVPEMGVVATLSTTGMFVRSAAVRPVGARLRIVFWDEQGQAVRLTGSVVRVVRANGNAGMGIRFDRADAPVGTSIECVIARHRLTALARMDALPTEHVDQYVAAQFGDAVAAHIAGCDRCRNALESISSRGGEGPDHPRRAKAPRTIGKRLRSWLRSWGGRAP